MLTLVVNVLLLGVVGSSLACCCFSFSCKFPVVVSMPQLDSVEFLFSPLFSVTALRGAFATFLLARAFAA